MYMFSVYIRSHSMCVQCIMCIYRYSCDEGMNWSDFSFMNSPIVVWGIVTEPGETTTQVLLVA